MSASQLELEKLIAIGEKLGLTGVELKKFIDEERVTLKQERDEEREQRAIQRKEQKEEEKELIEAQGKIEQEKARQLELQLEIQRYIQAQAQTGNNGGGSSQGSKGRAPKLPSFNQERDDIDAYLHRFELYATSQKWNKTTEWATNLGALLQGDALFEYSSLSLQDATDYDKVKTAVLKAYHLTTDGFRKRFRDVKPTENDTGTRFVTRLKNYLQRWMELENVGNFDQMQDLILREQFVNCCSKDHATFLKERKPATITAMAKLSDQYLEARGGWHLDQAKGKSSNYNKPSNSNSSKLKNAISYKTQGSSSRSTYNQGKSSQNYKRTSACFICGKKGHFARDCRQKQTMAFMSEVVGEMVTKRTEMLKTPQQRSQQQSQTQQCQCNEKTDVGSCLMVQPDTHLDQASREGFLTLKCGHQLTVLSSVACKDKTDRVMPVKEGKVGNHRVQVLRDSGCSGVVVKSRLVESKQRTGEVKTCILIDGTVRQFPVATIEVDTPYFVGSVSALCMDDPVYELILGNVPGVREPTDPDENWGKSVVISNVHVSVLDKNKDSKHEGTNERQQDLGSAVQTRSQRREEDKPLRKLKVTSPITEEITADMLAKQQHKDPSLKKMRELAKTGEQKVSNNGSTYKYIVSKSILYREFQSPQVEFGDTLRQVVVPSEYRQHVLKIAHESVLGGHLGVKKTKDKIMTNFIWPGIQADTTRYCQSCDVCQRTIPKGRVTKVPLGSVPLIGVPFQRVAVDLVGPIKPSTERGHRYILVLVDYATRYPEAVPLKTIETEAVAEALLSIYSRLGFPQEVLTDQGSQFVSGVMREVSRLLSIRRLTTTPYHAMANGLVEKFNACLKSMIKKMCEERPRDWDRYIGPLLFAYREAPQDSTGFSPFELLYGRTVRGPMTILKELWTKEAEVSETKSVYQYVLDLQDRLEQTCQLARKELMKSRSRYRKYYNKRARVRDMKVGDEVLLLLPTDKNKLLMQWKGPFPIVEKVSTMNYKVDLGQRTKTFHANLLKKYQRRIQQATSMLESSPRPITSVYELACTSVIEEEPHVEVSETELHNFSNEELLHLPPMVQKEHISEVNKSPRLDRRKMRQVRRLLEEFEDVLTDIPGKTTLGEHVIKVRDPEPIRSKPYPMPHALRKEMQKEVQTMIRMGVVSLSDSPYACPLVAVAKPDGSRRVCFDARRINQVTVFDAEPIPDQEEIFAQLAKDKYFSKIDLSKGYWQIPMAEDSKPLTAFVTHDGLYQFNTMPFGLVNAAATFSRVMRKLLRGLDNVHNYIDDILIHTETWESHLQKVREVFRRLRLANLTARPTKCFIGYDEVEFLGHIVGQGIMKPKPDKVEAIQKAEQPTTKKQIRSFLGLAGYYRKFIPNFAAVAAPLTDCTKKGEPNVIRWGENQDRAFHTLKEKLSKSPILQLPDLNKEFTLRTDASDTGVGAILLQKIAGEMFPVAYASKKLNKCQRKYSVMERECLAVVWAVLKFEPYLYGKEFTLETDHQPLTCVRKSKVANGRIMRWALALQPYRFRLKVIKGTENVGADYLSRNMEAVGAGLLTFI